MTFADLPAMLSSDTRGWQDVARLHPTVPRLMLLYVVPMSLIPPALFVFAVASGRGELFPALVPAMSLAKSLLVAVVFFAAEIGMVLLMGSLIREMGELVDAQLPYGDGMLLAAIASTPLWSASLVLLVPSLAVIVVTLAIAWGCCAAPARPGGARAGVGRPDGAACAVPQHADGLALRGAQSRRVASSVASPPTAEVLTLITRSTAKRAR